MLRAKASTDEALRAELEVARRRIAELESERRAGFRRDHLTGALGLDAFLEAAEREIERRKRNGMPLTLAVIDVDGFRTINAHRGPRAGDQALTALAERVGSSIRSCDLLARTGSDEFAVLMPETDLAGGRQAAERLIAEIERDELPLAGWVTVSIGVAPYEPGQSADLFLGGAGEALERARRAGGGRVETLEEIDPETVERMAHIDVIEALATTLTERDRYTGEHSESVVQMARKVAGALGCERAEVERIGAAALLHDIGKIAIPDQILNKPAALDADEWLLMKEHPVIGERILRAIPGMGGVARIVRHEHESFDGSGYPDGLAGETIPIGSRIILACDTYHAMTSTRPYRAAMPHSEAVRELARCAGTQFDPKVTEALIGYLYQARQAGEIADPQREARLLASQPPAPPRLAPPPRSPLAPLA